ncbi:uncharacterized protein PpBr36_10900 [Pyricularia pennisetigena]|uniref:uncharacterized protein n=1 Tax=Pyricularia pennisetigena TaxID=1578925 RepID=UPI00114D7A5F|nr:uncharacterized protein PpBr36_10900 [Pyricularia pennisetigena]TLS20806.1 hypothetical protein PpBr36_10900 [Pyricularia pennisetigena]
MSFEGSSTRARMSTRKTASMATLFKSRQGKTRAYQVADVNAQGGRYGNALYAASEGGHDNTVRMFLDKGTDANAQGGAPARVTFDVLSVSILV